MALSSHINQLELRHRDLELKIEQALARPGIDDMEIVELKRQKLLLKDKIETLKKDAAVH